MSGPGHGVRLWSLHPRYLDRQGLVALWREALLAQKVLDGKTRGYRHHPQLARFREHRRPVAAIGAYLRAVADEAKQRGYQFDSSKILSQRGRATLSVTAGQLRYEREHLLRKLARRDPAWLERWAGKLRFTPHPCFRVRRGAVEPWEKTSAPQ